MEEETALTGEADESGEWTFRVMGRQSAWLIEDGERRKIAEPIKLGVNTTLL